MGLWTELGLEPVEPNPVQRSLQRFAATRAGIAVFSRTLAPLDRAIHRITKGRMTVGRSFAALPVVLLTTTGARTGKQRTTPLTAIPVGDNLALIGSNFGNGITPAWAHNLFADPDASIIYNGRSCNVTAHETEGTEYEQAFDAAIRTYPGYAYYRRNATNVIPVFLLVAKDSMGTR